MNRHIYFIIIMLLFISCIGESFPGLEDLIPDKSMTVDVMSIEVSNELEILADKFQSSAQANPEWWMEYIQANASEKPLPYHVNFGISIDEYNKMLTMFDELYLKKSGEAEFLIEKRPNDIIRINIEGVKEGFSYLEICISKEICVTPVIRMTEIEKDIKEDGGVIGPWFGWTWNFGEEDMENGNAKTVTVSFGVVKETGKRFLAYTQKVMKDFSLEIKGEYMFFFKKEVL